MPQTDRKVWSFMGDGECDEPESLGAISLGGREQLDNLCFVMRRMDADLYEAAEPLMIPKVNTWHLRPDAWTAIPNLFLAADYIRTYTQLATMEAANEAARRAVNSIISASGANVPLCRLWQIHEPDILGLWRWYDQRRYDRGQPWVSELPWFINALQTVIVGLLRLMRR